MLTRPETGLYLCGSVHVSGTGKPNNDGFKAVAREESAKAMASEQSSS